MRSRVIFFILLLPLVLRLLSHLIAAKINLYVFTLPFLAFRELLLTPYVDMVFILHKLIPENLLTSDCFDIGCPSDLFILTFFISIGMIAILSFLLSKLIERFHLSKIQSCILLGCILLIPFVIRLFIIATVFSHDTSQCISEIRSYPYLRGKIIGDVSSLHFSDVMIGKRERMLFFKLWQIDLVLPSVLDTKKNSGGDMFDSGFVYPLNEDRLTLLCKLEILGVLEGVYPLDQLESNTYRKKYFNQ